MSRKDRDRNRSTQPPSGDAPASGDVIDPNADVNLDQFAGDDTDDDEADDSDLADQDRADADHMRDLQTPKPDVVTDAAPRHALAEDVTDAAPSRRALDVVLRIAGEIATEARRIEHNTPEKLIAFHDFIVARLTPHVK